MMMTKAKPPDLIRKLGFDTRLLEVHLTGLQAEVEAKLRRVTKVRDQVHRIDPVAGSGNLAQKKKAAAALIQQVDAMQETNALVRETLLEIRRAAEAILADLGELDSSSE